MIFLYRLQARWPSPRPPPTLTFDIFRWKSPPSRPRRETRAPALRIATRNRPLHRAGKIGGGRRKKLGEKREKDLSSAEEGDYGNYLGNYSCRYTQFYFRVDFPRLTSLSTPLFCLPGSTSLYSCFSPVLLYRRPTHYSSTFHNFVVTDFNFFK